MPYLEYIMEQEKSENKNVTAQWQYAAASGNNKLLLILQSVCVGDAWLLYCLFHTKKYINPSNNTPTCNLCLDETDDTTQPTVSQNLCCPTHL